MGLDHKQMDWKDKQTRENGNREKIENQAELDSYLWCPRPLGLLTYISDIPSRHSEMARDMKKLHKKISNNAKNNIL